MRNTFGLVAGLFVVAACSSSGKTASTPAMATESYTVSFGPVTVPAGVEKTQCVVKRLGNPGALHVGSIHNALGTASHHMIVYRVNDTQEILTPFDCKPFTDALDPTKGSPLMVTQKKDEVLTLPTGVAFSLEANQMVRLEMHYINPTGADVQLMSTSTMTSIDEATFKDEGDFLFIGNPDIVLPPHTKTTLGPSYFAPPSVWGDAKFFAITGHEHQLGTKVTIETAATKDGPGTSIYDIPNWNWAEPTTARMDPPITLPDGGGFRFTCEWDNTTDTEVKFGESANNEMCFFWAYYYPSHGSKVCFHSDKISGGINVCCPGDILCGLVNKP